MDRYLTEVATQLGTFILENQCTIRQAAKNFGMAKSTVHTYVSKKLPFIDTVLAEKVAEVLKFNFLVRHLRGGESTRQYYQRRSTNKIVADGDSLIENNSKAQHSTLTKGVSDAEYVKISKENGFVQSKIKAEK